MNKKAPNQDEIKKMLATLCEESENVGINNRMYHAFELGVEWKKLEEKKELELLQEYAAYIASSMLDGDEFQPLDYDSWKENHDAPEVEKREKKLCLCPHSVDCYAESDGRCTHV